MMRICLYFGFCLFPCTFVVAGSPDDAWAILEQQCVDCHGNDEQNGGLSFTSPQTLFSAADSGKAAVVAGQPEASELIRRVLSSDEDLRMPPDGEQLSGGQVETLRSWIREGASANAFVPAGGSKGQPAADQALTDHWSFQPISRPLPPDVNNASWPQTPVDRFILAQLERTGLEPVAEASPPVIARRLHYGLIGLPPTASELNRFLAEVRAVGLDQAMQRLVDQLLDRKEYGERWGRHWMDWVRYADTAGDNSDFPIPQAYLYRNYVIDSFNADVPYDRFLVEQLAGDLLPAEDQAERNRLNIATGYLAMARRFGSLVERYPWHLTIEDTIDNVGRTMMGLTLACARCHDHKFDPISTRDYYGLYGIFASTRYPFPGLELFQVQKDLVPLIDPQEAAAKLAPFQAKTDELSAKLERLLAECQAQEIRDAADGGGATLDEQRKRRDKLDAMLLKARSAGNALADHLKELPVLPTAYSVQDGPPQDAKIQIKGEPTRPGATVARKFPDVLGGQQLPEEKAVQSSGRLELAHWITSSENPLTARVIVNRVWQRHFGEGLVASTSDFGLRGQLPSHPQLLDWLASELIRNDWSIKHLHRVILSSRTYRLASTDTVQNLQADPGNRLHWKFSRQRMDAESLRDTLLHLASTLDRSPQTEPYPIPEQKEWEYTQHHPFKDDYQSNRRSVYLMTKRLTVQPYFQTFDGPDPNVCTSDRDQSVTSLQALFFVNDEFLHEQAQRFAVRLAEMSGSAERKARFAFTSVLCRPPSQSEQQLLVQHFAKVRSRWDVEEAELAAWSSVARSLLRLNEFLYID